MLKNLVGRLQPKLYLILYFLVCVLLIMPWIIYNKENSSYSFLPRQVYLLLIAFIATGIVLREKIHPTKIFIGWGLFGLGLLHWAARGYIEPHYFYQFIHLEIASLIMFAPREVMAKILKYSSWILYALLAKVFIYKIGSFFHGGFYSSNLYGTYIIYLCFIEVYRKRHWNLIPAAPVIYFIGSKACYVSFLVLLALVGFSVVQKHSFMMNLRRRIAKLYGQGYFNFYASLAISGFVVLIFTKAVVPTEYYQNWLIQMTPTKTITVQNNMVLYGLVEKNKDTEEQRRVLQKTKDMQFDDRKFSVTAAPLITDVTMSVGLRVSQYEHIFSNLDKYFFTGDAMGSQVEMFGNNPHSAIPDFVSRLGLLYFIIMLVAYKKLFSSMNLFFFNLALLPLLTFQPYGFTIGHSLIVLAFSYALAKAAKAQNHL